MNCFSFTLMRFTAQQSHFYDAHAFAHRTIEPGRFGAVVIHLSIVFGCHNIERDSNAVFSSSEKYFHTEGQVILLC